MSRDEMFEKWRKELDKIIQFIKNRNKDKCWKPNVIKPDTFTGVPHKKIED